MNLVDESNQQKCIHSTKYHVRQLGDIISYYSADGNVLWTPQTWIYVLLMAALLFVLICTQANLGRRKLLKSPHASLELFFIDFYVLFN